MSPSATDLLFAGAAGFAHRGRHGNGVPENSLAAFRAALAAGDGIECDLRLSRDGVPVVFHDPQLARLCGRDEPAEALDAPTLTACTLAGTTERIPRLAELLALVDGRVPVLLELKTAPGRPPPPVGRLCRAVAVALAGYHGPLGIMSFDPRVSQWFRRHAPDLPRGLVLGGTEKPWRRRAMLLFGGATFAAVHQEAACLPWTQRLRRRGVPVASWTIRNANTLVHLAKCIDAPIWEGDGRPRTRL